MSFANFDYFTTDEARIHNRCRGIYANAQSSDDLRYNIRILSDITDSAKTANHVNYIQHYIKFPIID